MIKVKTDKNLYVIPVLLVMYTISLAFLIDFGISGIPNKIYLPEIIFLVCFPLVLLKREFTLNHWDSLDWLFTLYIISNLISSYISKNEASIIESCGKIYLFFVYRLSKQFFLYKKAEIFLYKAVSILLWVLVITGLAGWSLATLGISFKYVYTYPNYPYFGNVLRLQGFTSNPTMFISILSCFLLVYREKFITTDGKAKLWDKILLSISILCILLTYSKSIILTLLGVLLVLFRFSRLQFGILVVSTTLFLFFSTNFYIGANEKEINKEVINLNPILTLGNYNVYETIYLSRKKVLIDQFLNNPIWGLGVGNTNVQLKNYQTIGLYPKNFDTNCDPNSTYLGILAETGIVGFVIFVLIGWKLSRLLKSALKMSGIQYSIAVCFVIGSIEAVNTDMLNFRHYWLLIGFLAIVGISSKNTDSLSIK